jgi:O-antigen/teichoic acid export membrane protein
MIVLVELLRQRRAYLPARCRLDRTGILELARYGVPILLGTAGGVVLGMSDRFLISHFHGVGVAGVYALAYALAFRIDTLTMFMSAAAFPLLIHDYEAGRRDQVAFELSRLIALFSAAFAPACTGVALIAGPLVTLLLGPEFHDASSYIVPLMPGVFAAGIHHYLSRPLMLAAKTQPQLYLTLAGAVLNVSLNLVLLPRHGAMAAAWTSSACLILVSVGTYLWSLRYLPYRQDWRGLTKIAAATALMALAVSVSGRSAAPHWALLVKIAVGMGVYGAAALVLDVPGARRTVRRILRRRAAVG